MTKVYDNATDLITFARSSSGTALRRVGYGDELVVDGSGNWVGDFDVAADVSEWSVNSSSTISFSSGKLRITNATSYGLAYQSIPVEVGRTYTVTVTGIAGTAPARPRAGYSAGDNTVWQGPTISSGEQTETFTFTSTGQTLFITLYAQTTTVGQFAEFDNISVKEVIFDRATDDLVLFDHPDDIPRIEYAADGSLKGLLIEEQRTNLVTYSEDFSQWSALTQGTGSTPVLTAGYASPDGGNNAYRLQLNAGGNTSNDYSLLRTTFTPPSSLSRSIWIKSNTGSDQTVALVATNSSTKVTATTEWQRLSDGVVTSGTGQMDISLGGAALTPATADILIYGAQAEAGSFPTSYIPTSGSQSTRSPDIASIPVSAFGYNQTAGTVVVEFGAFSVGSISAAIASLTDDPVSNDWASVLYLSSSALTVTTRDTGVNQTFINILGDFRTSGGIVGAAMKENSFAASVNGSTPQTDSSGTMPTDVSIMRIGAFASNPTYLNGHIKSLQYFPRRLTDAQLQELTA